MLKSMYHAFIRSKVDYAAPAWQPGLSNSNMICMESFQDRTLLYDCRLMHLHTRIAANGRVNVQSYTIITQRNILKAKERSIRCAAAP